MYIALLASVALWLLFVYNWLRFRDVLYPGALQSLVWAVLASIFTLYNDWFISVSGLTWSFVFIGAIFFSLGAGLVTMKHTPVKQRVIVNQALMPKKIVFMLAMIIALVFLPQMYLRAMDLGSSGPFDDMYKNMRYALAGGEETYGHLMYAMWFAYITAGLFLMKSLEPRVSRIWHFFSLLAFLIALAYAILMTGRSFVLFLCTILAGIAVILRFVSPKKIAIIMIIVCVLIFSIYAIVLQKGGDIDSSMYENIISLAETALLYVVGSIPAFDLTVTADQDLDWGLNTFIKLNGILNSISDANLEIKPIKQDFVAVPMPTNLYTFYLPYYLDFGFLGIIIFPLLAGALHGFFYRKASSQNPSPIWVIWYAIFIFPLITQNGVEIYMSFFNHWVTFAIAIYFIFGILRKGSRNKKYYANT